MKRFSIFGGRNPGPGGESNDAATNNSGHSNGPNSSLLDSPGLPPTPGDTGAGRMLFRNFSSTAEPSPRTT